MKTTTLLPVASLCLLASNARAVDFPQATVVDGVGVNAGGVGFSPEQARALRAAGVSVVRSDFSASEIARTSGDGSYYWHFDGYDGFVRTCAEAGLRIYGVLSGARFCNPDDFGPDVWWCYGTQTFRNNFDEFAYQTVLHYRELAAQLKAENPSWNSNFTWELWNEPNGGFWPKQCVDPNNPDCAPTNYDAIHQAAIQYTNLAVGVLVFGEAYPEGALQAIRDADPNATIVAPAVATSPGQPQDWWTVDPTDYLTTCFDGDLLGQNQSRQNRIDGVSAHFYRAWNPETVVTNLTGYAGVFSYDSLHTLMGTSGIPIVSGEWGYTLEPYWPVTPQMQADYLQRMLLINFSQNIPLSIWFQDEDRYDQMFDWYFGLFKNYCESSPNNACKQFCNANPSLCTQYCEDLPDICANICVSHGDQCSSCGDSSGSGRSCADHFYFNQYGYGTAKPAFYGMKTLTSSLKSAHFNHPYGDGRLNDYLMIFNMPRWGGEREILAAWTVDTAAPATVRNDPWWGSFMMTGTPMYLGSPLDWNGSSSWSYGFGGWPNDYATQSDNFQARFAQSGTVYVDGEYYLGGLQFLAGVNVLPGATGGKLRLTPGGGNLYVEDNVFSPIYSVLADTVDRNSSPDPLTFTNTPETFVLRKSGGGEVGLLGNNTFHGRILVGEGILDLGSSQALGDPSNPVTLAGGGIDLNGQNPTTGPMTVTADSTIFNYGLNASTYTPESLNINSGNLSFQGGPAITIAGPITVSGGKLSPGGVGSVGTLTVRGSVKFSPLGSLDIDLGTRAGSCDVLAMTGSLLNRSLTLGGTLNLYGSPLPGKYPIITGAISVTGSFTIGVAPAGHTYKLSKSGLNYVLTVT